MSTLRLTAAGRAALADGTNRQTRNVQLRALVLGDGTNPGDDDDARTALRSQQDRQAVTGATDAAGRIALRATYTPSATYAVTETGVIARIGAGGAEFLLGYWAAPNAAAALVQAVSDTTLVVTAIVDVTDSEAEVAVDAATSLTLANPGTLLGLSDTPAAYAAGVYLRANAAGDAAVWRQAPPVVATEADLPAAATTPQSTYLVTNYDGSGYPALAIQAGGTWYFCWARAAFPENSKTEPGLAELATNTEHTRTGSPPPGNRGATPAGIRAEIDRQITARRSR